MAKSTSKKDDNPLTPNSDDQEELENTVDDHEESSPDSADENHNHNTKKKKRKGSSLSILTPPVNQVRRRHRCMRDVTTMEGKECNAHLMSFFANRDTWTPQEAAGWYDAFTKSKPFVACNQNIGHFLERWPMKSRIHQALQDDYDFVEATACAVKDSNSARSQYAQVGAKLGKRRRTQEQDDPDWTPPPTKKRKKSTRRTKKKKGGATPREFEDLFADASTAGSKAENDSV